MKKIITLTMGTVLAISLAACDSQESSEPTKVKEVTQESSVESKFDEKATSESSTSSETNNSDPAQVEEEETPQATSTPKAEPVNTTPSTSKTESTTKPETSEKEIQEVTVYRSNSDASGLVGERMAIDKSNDTTMKAMEAFKLLKTTPKEESSASVVPQNVNLKGATTTNSGTNLILDFTETALFIPGTASEQLFVDGVNKTMFELLPEVNHILYHVEGKPTPTLSHLDVSQGFSRK